MCSGTGAQAGSTPQTCPHCHGRGQVSRSHGFFSISTTCPQCGGEGRVVPNPCKSCKGTGLVKKEKKVTLHIPPGVESGSRLRLREEGEEGERGAPPGDLYVIIYVEPHDFFEREGDDVLCRIPVSFILAILGGEIEIPTLDGMKKIHIPQGTQPGEIFRLRGEGIHHLHSRGRGDLIVQTAVQIPKSLSKEQEVLLKEFAALEEQGGVDPGKTRKKSKKGISF